MSLPGKESESLTFTKVSEGKVSVSEGKVSITIWWKGSGIFSLEE